MPTGKLVFSGMEFVKSSRGGSSVRISVWRGTNTGGSTGEREKCHRGPCEYCYTDENYIIKVDNILLLMQTPKHRLKVRSHQKQKKKFARLNPMKSQRTDACGCDSGVRGPSCNRRVVGSIPALPISCKSKCP